MLPKFDLIQPRTLAEALDCMNGEETILPMCGGTDVFVRLRAGVPMGTTLLSLLQLDELRQIKEEDSYIRIGAGCTFSTLEGNPLVQRYAPMLAAAAAVVGSPAIRNRATIGGNIENASPAGDGLVSLYGERAEIKLVSVDGSRVVPISEYMLAPKKTTRKQNELIVEIQIPKEGHSYQEFFKQGRRNALAISVVNGCISADADGDVLNHVRVVLGAVAITPVELPGVGELVNGKRYTRELDEQVQKIVEDAIQPIDDVRASKEYRRYIAGVHVRRKLRRAAGWRNEI